MHRKMKEGEETREGERMRGWDHSLGHTLNINDGFTNRFHQRVNSVNNLIYINKMLLYLLDFFNFFLFHYNYLGIYQENISIDIY
jgi:hypothetical protein